MIRQLRRTLASVFFLGLSSFAVAQNAQIQGQVTDASGALISKATVRAVNQQTGTERKVETNGSGVYTVSFLEPSIYKIFVQATGFSTAVSTPITLNVAQNAVLNFKLEVGSQSQTVTVDGSGLTINTTDASVSTVVDHKFVENMPLNGRSLQSLISLAPGVVQTPLPYATTGNSGEFSINGQRTESNYYTVDGVSANIGGGNQGGFGAGAAGGVPNQTALGTTQSLVSVDALQEFRISTSSYSAEYGRMPGGQIALQTRSGTDHLHGTLSEYFRNSSLDANNWFNDHTTPATPKTAERQNDFGGTVGGPVYLPHLYDGRHRTFFFYSYEGLKLTVPSAAVTVEVPSLGLRQTTPAALQPIVNAFPIPNGSEVSGVDGMAYFTGSYSLPSNIRSQSIRIDHALGNRTVFFGRYSDTSSSAQSRYSYDLANLIDNNQTTRSVTSGVTRSFTNNATNDLRFNYTWTGNKYSYSLDNFGRAQPATTAEFMPGTSTPYAQFAAYLALGSGAEIITTDATYDQTQLNFVDTQQFLIDHHSIKVGVDYRQLAMTQAVNVFRGIVEYFNAQQVRTNSAGFGEAVTAGNVPSEPVFTNFSAFAQDEWKITPRTTLSFGVRWDVNPPPGNGNGRIPPVLDQVTNLATAQIAPEGTPLWNTDYKGFAPRVGIASQLNNHPGRETVLRVGGGIFYDTGNTQGALGFQLLGFGSVKSYSNLSFPLPTSFYQLPAASTAAPYNSTAVGFERDLRLPYTPQWNVSIQQALGSSRSFTVGYIGSLGRRLIQGQITNPSAINSAFSAGNGAYIIRNGAWSNYNSLQAQYDQRLARGLQVLASMTWSHSIDNKSSGFIGYQPLLKGDSDFDIRQNFQIATTYNVPSIEGNRFVRSALRDWALDLRASSRTSAPVDVYGSSYVASDGTSQYARPNVVEGQPLYIYGPRSIIPGGRKLNFNAFQTVIGSLGNAPRNFLRGFAANQIDFAARREFELEGRFKLQLRLEAFNVLNHPNFGAIYNTLGTGATLFGQAQNTLNVSLANQSAIYEQGGPRSLQIAAKILF